MLDMEIVNNVLSGRRDDFGELVKRYERLVFSIALNMLKDRDMAEDAAQETFLKAYTHLATYNPEFKFSTWVSKITWNTCTDVLRKRREYLPIEEAEVVEDKGMTPEEEVVTKDTQQRLLAMLDGLEPKYREPLMLYHAKGLKYDEIADRMSVPMTIVKNRIFRARKMLREQLSTQ